MKVIGAGFGRSGTSSTFKALTDLGYKCYHMSECVRHDHVTLWNNFFEGDQEPLFREIQRLGYEATLDFPIIAIFDELLERNPDAKVLLNVRDNPKQWIKSFRGTIWKVMTVSPFRNILKYCGPPASMNTSTFTRDLHDNFFRLMIRKANTVRIQSRKLDPNFRNLSDEDVAEFYNSWIEYVKKVVPKEKLLVFNVKDGIKPLSQFCGKPEPDWPMPHINDTKDFGQMLTMGKVMSSVAWAGMVFVLLAIFDLEMFSNLRTVLPIVGLCLLAIPYVGSKLILRNLNANDGRDQFFKFKAK